MPVSKFWDFLPFYASVQKLDLGLLCQSCKYKPILMGCCSKIGNLTRVVIALFCEAASFGLYFMALCLKFHFFPLQWVLV